ncbi:MAG: hypothetical protein JNL82_10590 [Myxococcales bacterium]|jgi:hypothetical protein|nr:hypothetical protein [Myxococcales bacterium]
MAADRLLVLVLLVACGDSIGMSTSGSITETTNTTVDVPTTNGLDESETSSTSSTGDGSSSETSMGPMADPLTDYMPCIDGMCALGGVCVQIEGASICGPSCPEYGPGFAAGRCPEPLAGVALCPWIDVPAPCILGCATAADCPAEGMVCLPCEPPYADACGALNPFLGFEGSASMCAWPNP